MRVHWHSAAKALPFVALFLTALLTTSSARADWGIYQSYIIIEEGSTTTYYGGGINSEDAQAFAGSHLGTVAQGTSLTLNGGELKTWKNGNNGNSNVCGGTLFYRIYPNGSASGDYTGVALSYAGELGGGNQKWDATSAAIDLASGLSAGDYVVDVWWQAEGNQHGGCGQFQYDSNNAANFQATFTILSEALSLKGIIDFTVPSGGNDGKAIHVVANEDISDLSVFGLGVANNGGGSDGMEYTFPSMAVSAGDDILVVRSSTAMESYFGACYGGFEHVLAAGSAISQNGNDAIELFESSTVIETFGDINVDGTGEVWEYLDSWAYHDGTSWTYGTPNCTDGTTTIYDSACLYPMCPAASAASASGLFGTPLSTAAHSFATTTTPADAPNPDRWGSNLSAPYPTNAWWQDLTLLGQYGYGRVNCFPYQFRAVDNAMEFWLPEISHSGNAVTTSGSANWQFTAAETGLTHQITAYDELSVGVTFSNGSSGTMHMPLVRGMAFASSQYVGLTPKLTTGLAILSIHDAAGASLSQNTPFTGQEFTLALNNGQTWKLYSNQDVTWNWSGGALTSTASASDVWVRMALLNSSAVPVDWPAEYYIGQNQSAIEGLLDAHASAIPIGGSVDATVASDVATLQYNWSHASGSSGNFLIYALPHHQDILTETPSNDMWIRTIRGVMKAVSGESWTLTEPLSTITWNAPRAIPESRKPAIQEALKLSYNFTASNPSIYFGGKQLQGLSRLVLIADELGLTSDVSTFKTQLNSDLSAWLEGTVTFPLHYDTEWGGIIPGPSSSGADPYYDITFGVDEYNDHHFQYGHLIYAAAVLAKDDPAWVTQHGDVVMQLIRNIATPSHDDPIYPFMRNKDWFVGHSLAAGVGHPDLDGRNQESTSEAVNAWYAVALYGLAIGDDRIRDLGRLMLATELRSSHDYWQIQDADDIYPPAFESNKVVGRLWDAKVDYDTWFGSKTEYIHGIQYLPITPLSEELLRAEWMQEAYPVVSTALADPTLEEWWRSLIYSAHATIAPADAWNETMTLTGTDDGNPPANALHWVATRPNLPEETLASVSSDLATVQFSVDLSQESVVASPVVKVWIGDGFVDFALTDGDGDGVYTGEAALAMGAYSYKFVNNGVWESIGACHTCAVESGGYYNRQVEVSLGQSLFSETITLPTVCWNSCGDCSEVPNCNLNITATVCTSASSVQLTGPFWEWNTTSIPAAVDNGDGTWTFTIDTPSADMEYLLIVDGVQENLIPEAGGSCVGVTDYSNYANRLWTVGSGDVTGIVYGTCASTCGGVPGCTDATACNYDSAATTDDGSCQGIPSGDCDCNGNQNDACGVCGGSGTDVDADGICDDVDECTDTSACNYAADPTEPCTPCTTESVVFQVDVSDEPYSGELLVYMFGSFQASPWNIASATALQDPDGDGTFSVTLALQAGTTLEYKFLIGDGNYVETLASGTSCTLTTGQYTNRVYTVPTGGATLDAVCFGSCDVCPETGCMDATACNYDSNATSDDGSCVFVVDVCDVCNGDGSVTQPDSDGDGICDASDSCSDTSACNYNDSANGTCQATDACGVCGGSGTDVDNDGVCDDADNCTDVTACNYNDSANGTCQTIDACGVCGGNGTDVDNDGVCDDADNCTDVTACNYNDSANGTCQTIDACGVCGGSGTDVDNDGVCDDADNCTDVTACNYNDSANATCQTIDACGVCGGSGTDVDNDGVCDDADNCTDVTACNYNDSANGTCQATDACGVCGGSGTDVDNDGVCDDADNCTDVTACNYNDSANGTCQTIDACGVCGGSGTDVDGDGVCDDADNCTDVTACNYNDSANGTCQTIDACGVCGGNGTDVDGDGVCDDTDNCTDVTACNYNDSANGTCQTIDACGVCGGNGTDVDGDGVCDDTDNCTDVTACNYNDSANGTCQTIDACGVCGGNGTDVDNDGVCDDTDNCTDVTACNYNDPSNPACDFDLNSNGICDALEPQDSCIDEAACNYGSDTACLYNLGPAVFTWPSGTETGQIWALDDTYFISDIGWDEANGVYLGIFEFTNGTHPGDSFNNIVHLVTMNISGGTIEVIYGGNSVFGYTSETGGFTLTLLNNTDVAALSECCESDSDADGICDDVDTCDGIIDGLGVCGGNCPSDYNGDGICDVTGTPGFCIDEAACNYGAEAACLYNLGPAVFDWPTIPASPEGSSTNGQISSLDNSYWITDIQWDEANGVYLGIFEFANGTNLGDSFNNIGHLVTMNISGSSIEVIYGGNSVFGYTAETGGFTLNLLGNTWIAALSECCAFDVDGDGVCDDVDTCEGIIDALGVCAGDCLFDLDEDGICDDVDDCLSGAVDAVGVCGGACLEDLDNNGICDTDDIIGCMDVNACNYNADATSAGSCLQPATGYDCSNNCLNDTDLDGVCDEFEVAGCQDIAACNYDPLATDSNGTCTYAGSGVDCAGNCLIDLDQDGLCDYLDNCANPSACNYDDPTATGCWYDTDNDGLCDDVDNCPDTSACNYSDWDATSCWYDTDNDGLCDDVDNCPDTTACNYNDWAATSCSYDYDNDGLCDNVDNCPDTSACNYNDWAATSCSYDYDNDGLCDNGDNCLDTSACNYDDWSATTCWYDSDSDGVCDNGDNCTDTTACNYDDWSATTCWYDSDSDGVCDNGDNCLDTSACNYDDWSATTCWYDSDSDGVCDNGDNCTDVTACNYNDSANGTCQTTDACGVCGGNGTDVDSDGVCDDADNCTDVTACNYNDSANGTCQTTDACGVCGGNGTDVDSDGVCDDVDNCTDVTACNYNDSANGTCQTLDECGVCGGSGIASGACDCDGNQNDALGVCGGTCAADADSDGICDDVDDCVGTLDALGVCNGTCAADADNDGICDSEAVPGCTDATACNYNEAANVNDDSCTYATTWYADADGDGTGHTYTFVESCSQPEGYVATSGDTCPNDPDKLSPGTCGCGNVDVDVDGDGLCDTQDGCTDNTACNYDNPLASACLSINSCGNCAAPTTVTCGLQGACNYDASGDCFNDDLCDFDSCAGCMNNTACNYDATATISAPLTCTFPAYAWENCSGECLNDADANGVCDEVEIPGCMDSAAINYNPNASTDDGSCFTEIVGCIIPSATNYDPAATVQGSPLTTYCTFPPSVPVPWFLMTNPGCMDSNACNYDDTATTSDGSCEYTSCQGCDVAGACNYDASVLYNDGSCEWTSCLGCMNSSACDYDATATIADTCDFDSCQGCTNSAASNYDATATQDDGSCIIDGCTNASACNYDATATNNDGSCTYAAAYYDCSGDCNNDTDSDGVCDELEVSGCTNSSACNYDALATDDDGLCTLPTTWYQDLDGDGSGDASATQEACVQPIGYVSSAGDNCPSNASKTDPGLCGCSAADVDTDSDGLCDTSDNCTDTTACNYDDSANEACEFATTYYQDADGDGLGNASVSNAVCSDTPPTGYVADNTDNCDNLLADNYNDGGNPACTFASGADYAAQDSLLLCDGGTLSIDLDTLHTGSQAGTWSYSLNGALDAFGSATISGSVLTVDGSANGTGRDTLSVSGAGNSETADLTIIVQESTYPVVTGQYLVLPSSPGALDGGVQFTFEGHYDAPVAVQFLHHPTDTTDADGSLILRSDAYWISAFTNDRGCSNPAPATSTTPTESTTPKAMAIPYILED